MNCLQEIFFHQRELMDRFHRIETTNRSDLRDRPAVITRSMLNVPMNQLRIREYAWRIVEEIGEAFNEGMNTAKKHEEIADAFHFLIEMFIVCDMSELSFESSSVYSDALAYAFAKIETSSEDFVNQDDYWMAFIRDLSMTMNVLKNKPWKSTYRSTDTALFFTRMQWLLTSFCRAAFHSGLRCERLYEEYMRKADVNHRRIDAGQ